MLTFKAACRCRARPISAPTASLAAATADEIAETAFAALRHYQKISAALRRPHAQPEKAALAALVLGRSINLSQIEPLLLIYRISKQAQSAQSEFASEPNTAAELPQWLIDTLAEHLAETDILSLRPQRQLKARRSMCG